MNKVQGHVCQPLSQWLSRKGVAMPPEWSMKARCAPSVGAELKQIEEGLEKVSVAVKKKVVRNAKAAHEVGLRTKKVLKATEEEEIGSGFRQMIWQNMLEGWLSKHQEVVKEEDVMQWKQHLQKVVVTHVDRLPGEGLIV